MLCVDESIIIITSFTICVCVGPIYIVAFVLPFSFAMHRSWSGFWCYSIAEQISSGGTTYNAKHFKGRLKWWLIFSYCSIFTTDSLFLRSANMCVCVLFPVCYLDRNKVNWIAVLELKWWSKKKIFEIEMMNKKVLVYRNESVKPNWHLYKSEINLKYWQSFEISQFLLEVNR